MAARLLDIIEMLRLLQLRSVYAFSSQTFRVRNIIQQAQEHFELKEKCIRVEDILLRAFLRFKA